MTTLPDYLATTFSLPADHADTLAGCFVPEKFSAGDIILRRGSYHPCLSLIETGYVRLSAPVKEREVTQWISGPGYFVTDVAALHFGCPARYQLTALSQVRLHSMSRDAYGQLERKIPDWSRLERDFIGSCFVTLEERVLTLLSLSAAERYERLLSEQPELFLHAPLQYIASMLGMSPATLSRLRAVRGSS